MRRERSLALGTEPGKVEIVRTHFKIVILLILHSQRLEPAFAQIHKTVTGFAVEPMPVAVFPVMREPIAFGSMLAAV